jgi:hypothetical protein
VSEGPGHGFLPGFLHAPPSALVETVLKTILDEYGQKSAGSIPDLLKRVQVKLGLDARAARVPEPVRRMLSNLGNSVIGVAEVRNLFGTGHGRSKSKELEEAEARFVVNGAVTVATLLLELWEAQGRP